MSPVHAVGDVRDRHRVHRPLRPQAMPHLPRHTPMPAADRVRRPAHPQAELGDAKRLGAVRGMLTAEPHDRVGIGSQLGDHAPERGDHVLAGVGLVACADRRVRREHRAPPGGLERRLDRRATRRLAACQLEHGKRRMPLVQMHQRRLDPHRRKRRTPRRRAARTARGG